MRIIAGSTDKSLWLDPLARSPLTERSARSLPLALGWLAAAVLVAMSLFHLYTGTRGEFTAMVQRSTHLGFAMGLAFLLFPATAKWGGPRLRKWLLIPDLLLALLAVFVTCYVAINHVALAERAGAWSSADLIVGGLALILILDATRRSVSPMLAYIAGAFLLYAMFFDINRVGLPVYRMLGDGSFSRFITGTLCHTPVSLEDLISNQYFTQEGVFGVPLQVSSTFVFLFVLFGAFLEKGGAGQYLIDLAFSTMGRFRGGPAKAAVVASGLMGTISGSSIANTVSTGTMTIPLMKKAGFRPHIAAAVEVAASTNGQLMPPVMGAAAFIMAEFTQIPYRTIVIAALLPAVLSYVAIFTMIHLEAVRTGMKAGRREDMPSLRSTLARGLLLNLPFVTVIVFLLGLPAPIARVAAPYIDLTARTPTTSATLAIWVTIGLFLIMSMFLPRTTYGLSGLKGHGIAARSEFFGQRIWLSLRDAAINMVGIACACACCGIIIGVVSQTGLAGKLTNMVLSLSTAITMPSFLPQALPALLLTMIACLVLGIGLPTTATYIIMSTLTVTAILKLMAPDGNVDISLMLATHLFVFYYGIMADDTPPVGLCAYAAAGIAGSDPVRTGFASFRFDLAAFTLPLIFFFNRELLLQDAHWLRLVHVVPFAIMGMMCFAAVLQGFAWDRLRWWERVILLAVSFLFVSPELTYSLAGLAVLAVLIGVHRLIARLHTA